MTPWRPGGQTRTETGSAAGFQTLRRMRQNELALAAMPSTVDVVHHYKQQLWTVAMPENATVEQKLRVRLAIMAVLLADHGSSDLGGTPAERQDAAQRIAADVMP